MVDVYGFEPTDHRSGMWEINLESPEITFLRETKTNIPREEFDIIINSASNILSNCPSPTGPPVRRTGLAIGRIQSGKTLSFTTLIALAAENGYRIIVVLAGTKIPLMNQTYERLKMDLGIMQEGGPPSRFFLHLSPRENAIGALNNALESGRCLLLVVLKHRRHIAEVSNIINNLQPQPVLIIDDEGDEASLNTRFRSREQSAIYGSILDLRNLPSQPHAYIAYTATPQANLLIDTIDLLSPDFCELIDPGRGYCGAEVFFGEHMTDYVRSIDDLDEDHIDGGRIPESLRNAICFFFVSAVIRHIRSPDSKHSMLIHMNVRTAFQNRLLDSISLLINSWKDRMRLNVNDPSRQNLINEFIEAYDDLVTTVTNPPTWNIIENRLLAEIFSTQIHVVNSSAQGMKLDENSFQLNNHIVIGGNILGRGLTIPNLSVSYMTRRARRTTNADTMEQRARWFGYKLSYLDICRIYITERVRQDFRVLREHEDDFWESLRRNIRQTIPFTEWKRFFVLTDLNLNPTRSCVARFKRFRPAGWESQNDPIRNSLIVEENKRNILNFFQTHNGTIEHFGGTEHTVIRNCPIEEAIQLLKSINTEGTQWESPYYIEYLERLHLAGRIEVIDLFLMNKGNQRERTIEENGKINNLMQGRSATYLGDSYLHNNRPQIQFSIIAGKVNEQIALETTAIALFIPENEVYNLSFIVRDEI